MARGGGVGEGEEELDGTEGRVAGGRGPIERFEELAEGGDDGSGRSVVERGEVAQERWTGGDGLSDSILDEFQRRRGECSLGGWN